MKFEVIITNLLQAYENSKQILENGIRRWQYGIVVDEKDGDKMQEDEMHIFEQIIKYFIVICISSPCILSPSFLSTTMVNQIYFRAQMEESIIKRELIQGEQRNSPPSQLGPHDSEIKLP